MFVLYFLYKKPAKLLSFVDNPDNSWAESIVFNRKRPSVLQATLTSQEATRPVFEFSN
jgi:hypothetical protein